MIAAAIDIGTNTTLALLASGEGGTLTPLKDELTVNGLGEALKHGPTLSAETIALNVDLLAEIVRDFKRAGATAFALAGTSALRRAQNRDAFLAAVKQVLGLEVDVIGGRDEAALTYLGALSGREVYPGERVCVMDLGGGSTEIIEGKGRVPGQGYSIDVGSVMLTNEFFHHDPPAPEEVAALRRDLHLRLMSLVAGLRGQHVPWILVGGTVVTLALLKAGLRRYDPARVGGSVLSRADIEGLLAQFDGRPSSELQRLPGMPQGRGRVIYAGAILLAEMFQALNLEEGIVSERGLRHGLWLAKFGTRQS